MNVSFQPFLCTSFLDLWPKLYYISNTMITIKEIKALLAETVVLEKTLRATSDFRGRASSLYQKFKRILKATETNFGKDEEARIYADKVKAIVSQRIESMTANNEYNPVSVAVFEKTELDLLILNKHLHNEDFKIRLDAVAAVEELSYSEALSILCAALGSEEHPWVISKLVKVIGIFGGTSELELISPFLESDDDRIRANCIEGISAMKGDEKYPYIMRALEDPSNRVKANALNALKSLGGKEFTSLLKQMVNSFDEDVRNSVLFVLKNMNSPVARDCLLVLLKDRAPDIQQKSASLLGKFSDIITVKALTETAKAADSQKLKEEAIHSLSKIRERASGELTREINKHLKEAIAPSIEQKRLEAERERKEAEAQKQIEEAQALLASKDAAQKASEYSGKTAFDIDDSDLLAELASFSEPGDIPPSRVASGGKSSMGNNADDEDELSRDKEEKEQEAIRKLLNRMNTALKQLDPRLKMEAEKEIKKGKIKNESQLKQWLDRKRK